MTDQQAFVLQSPSGQYSGPSALSVSRPAEGASSKLAQFAEDQQAAQLHADLQRQSLHQSTHLINAHSCGSSPLKKRAPASLRPPHQPY